LSAHDEARLLIRKARQDQMALVRLAADAEIADAIVGFHAQQAAEKALKAVLAAVGEEYPRTHDLRHLIERLETTSHSVPAALRDARRLTPWAVEYRYGETIDDQLDRATTLELVSDLIAWAEGRLQHA
jgi:HEPN domain-containing protein